LGLVRDGVLVPTGETLTEVQARVLGGRPSSQLFNEISGHVALTVRGGYRLTPQLEFLAVGENLANANYRSLGSSVDAPGRSVRVHLGLRF